MNCWMTLPRARFGLLCGVRGMPPLLIRMKRPTRSGWRPAKMNAICPPEEVPTRSKRDTPSRPGNSVRIVMLRSMSLMPLLSLPDRPAFM